MGILETLEEAEKVVEEFFKVEIVKMTGKLGSGEITRQEFREMEELTSVIGGFKYRLEQIRDLVEIRLGYGEEEDIGGGVDLNEG